MSLRDAFAPAEALYRAEVMADTWGHLAPEPGRRYPGSIVAAVGEYGDTIVVRCQFEDLGDSPWFYEDLMEFVSRRFQAVGVFEWKGVYVRHKNGACRFLKGKIRLII